MKVEDLLNNSINSDLKNIKYDFHINKVKIKNDSVVIYIDNDEKITVNEEDYFKYNLGREKGFDNITYKVLKENEKELLAYNSCIRKLAIKDYSCKNIKDYLLKQKLDDDTIKNIINKLTRYNLLDDEKYCLNKIHYYSNNNISYSLINQNLIKDGINSSIILQYLTYNANEEFNKCLNIANKYDKTIKNKSKRAKKSNIYNKLINLGFKYEVVDDVLSKIDLNVDNELELLKKEYLKIKEKKAKKYEDYMLKQQIINSLISKGFDYKDIKQVMEDYYE